MSKIDVVTIRGQPLIEGSVYNIKVVLKCGNFSVITLKLLY